MKNQITETRRINDAIKISLKYYNADNYVYFSQLISRDHIGKIGILRTWNKRTSLTSRTVMLVRPNEVSIYDAKQGMYIFEKEYLMADSNTGNLFRNTAFFVIEDGYGFITLKDTKIYPNANGPDIRVNNYSLGGNVLVKYIGDTNITLSSGNLIAVPLFRTIQFSNNDPNRPML
jgi:hypothetical protein